MPRGIELRLGADGRRTSGETRELFTYVAGRADAAAARGRRDLDQRGFCRSDGRARPASTLTGGARLDYWQVSDGHLFEKTIATGAVLRDEHDATRDGWLPTARGGVLAPIGGGFSLRSAAYLGWRMPTLNELFRPFRAGLDATAANPELKPERLAGAEVGAEYAHGAVRLSLTGFVNRLKDAIANVTPGAGAGHLSRRRLRRCGRHLPPAAECRCGEGARDRGVGANGPAGRGRCAPGRA